MKKLLFIILVSLFFSVSTNGESMCFGENMYFMDNLLQDLIKNNVSIKIEYPEYVEGFPMIVIYVDTDKNNIYDIKISIDRNHPTDYMYLVDPNGKFDNGSHLKGSQTLHPTYPEWPIVPEWRSEDIE